MAISAISGYNSLLYGTKSVSSPDYQSWIDNANADAQALESSLAASSVSSAADVDSTDSVDSGTSGTSSVSGSGSTGTSAFLLNYKQNLEDLESVSEKLQVSSRNNVFSKYESALQKLSRAETDEEKESAQAAVDAAKQDIVSAVEEFAKQYNSTISFLERNADRSETVESQLNSLKRALPTEGALATVGLSINATGDLQVDEEKLSDALDKSLDSAKDTLGGQFGIAERASQRATSILDHASIESIAGTTTDSSAMSDFMWFANFANSGGYNLSNFYAVGALLDITA